MPKLLTIWTVIYNIFFMVLDKLDFVVLDHTADLGIMVHGSDIKNLFERAAHSMIRLMVSHIPAGKINRSKLSLDGEDLADLMILWLGEILYLFQGEKRLVTGIEIGSITPSHLEATLETVAFDPDLQEILYEIKAVTYHQIEVTQKHNCWETKVIFDL